MRSIHPVGEWIKYSFVNKLKGELCQYDPCVNWILLHCGAAILYSSHIGNPPNMLTVGNQLLFLV